LNGEDPTKYVLSANIHRRHMTKGQRAMAVAMVTQPAKGGRGKTVPVLEGFSKQRISEARAVLQHAPDLARQVLTGSDSLDDAYKMARERQYQLYQGNVT
jgi:hypothetical protein